MAIQYSEVKLGTMKIEQPKYKDGKLVKDSRGLQLYNKYEIQIRRGNCLAVFIYAYKENGQWYHQLYNFFNDVEHIKNMMKDPNLADEDGMHHLFGRRDAVIEIRLNTYFKECLKMLPFLTKDGYEVVCYYEKPE